MSISTTLTINGVTRTIELDDPRVTLLDLLRERLNLTGAKMGAALSSGPKTSPQHVAGKTVEGIHAGFDHVLADESAERLWHATRQNPAKLHAEMQARWDQRTASNPTQVWAANVHHS